ncbi:MAG TPA: acylphosphatase [Candidatus Eisenbacteria bacterium]|jgi:acylphosphatase|nr:acylphosphatase [Candidatus Eisenbacteria bacterium]
MPHVHVVIHGQVQGVGFRAFVAREAAALALAGEVRNRADGTVEVHAEGPRAALETLVGRLAQGPRFARVSHQEVTWSDAPQGHARRRRFVIAP